MLLCCARTHGEHRPALRLWKGDLILVLAVSFSYLACPKTRQRLPCLPWEVSEIEPKCTRRNYPLLCSLLFCFCCCFFYGMLLRRSTSNCPFSHHHPLNPPRRCSFVIICISPFYRSLLRMLSCPSGPFLDRFIRVLRFITLAVRFPVADVFHFSTCVLCSRPAPFTKRMSFPPPNGLFLFKLCAVVIHRTHEVMQQYTHTCTLDIWGF